MKKKYKKLLKKLNKTKRNYELVSIKQDLLKLKWDNYYRSYKDSKTEKSFFEF